MVKTRYWHHEDGMSSTAVQFRDDADPMVHLHTNMGWVPIGNTPKDVKDAEVFAEQLATGYNLQEANKDVAVYMLGLDDE